MERRRGHLRAGCPFIRRHRPTRLAGRFVRRASPPSNTLSKQGRKALEQDGLLSGVNGGGARKLQGLRALPPRAASLLQRILCGLPPSLPSLQDSGASNGRGHVRVHHGSAVQSLPFGFVGRFRYSGRLERGALPKGCDRLLGVARSPRRGGSRWYRSLQLVLAKDQRGLLAMAAL